jgi:hypothetical protein
MELWRTSAVNQRPHNGAFRRTSDCIEMSNEISDLNMAEQVVFETMIWAFNNGSESGRNQPFFDRERYTRDAAVSVSFCGRTRLRPRFLAMKPATPPPAAGFAVAILLRNRLIDGGN